MKGGYILIDLNGIAVTTGGASVTVSGIYEKIKNATKRVVLSGLTLDGELLADAGVTFELVSSNLVAILNEKKLTIASNDSVTVTATGGGGGGGGVTDVEVNGVSVVTDGVAEITLTDGVTDVEVNGTSVVTDGVAEITLTDEVQTAAEADLCTFKVLSSLNFTIDAPFKFKTDTVGDVSNVLVGDGNDSTTSASLSAGSQYTLVKSGDAFYGVIKVSYKTYLLEITPASNSYKIYYVSGGDKLIPVTVTLRTYSTSSVQIKYYKFK